MPNERLKSELAPSGFDLACRSVGGARRLGPHVRHYIPAHRISPSLDKETIGLAGEYAVASELCRRGAYCQLTLGNRKKTDLLVDTGPQLFRVSVKSKQKRGWPTVKGIWQDGDLLVFVDYNGKSLADPPDFYVLDVSSWRGVVRKILRRINDTRAKVDKENTIFWPGGEGEKNAFTGCQVLVSDVAAFKNAWPDLE
jgi:hypothetical protein